MLKCVCLSISLSVTFLCCIKMGKPIIKCALGPELIQVYR